MLKSFNLKDPFSISLVIILLSFCALIGPLTLNNILFWIALLAINYGIKISKISFQTLINAILIAISIYLQFIFDFKTVTKEFFVHVLGILMIFKFYELRRERDYHFYVNLSFFISVISLLDGQDLMSCLISLSIMLFGIYLLYIINQIKFPEFKFKNLLKIFGFMIALVPFIVGTYLIFPRANININILGPSQNKIGIPEKISLGSFNSITNTREKVFDVNFLSNQPIQKDFYFRVRVFDLLDKDNTWLPTPENFLINLKPKIRKVKSNIDYELIMSPHEKKWVPVLDHILKINQNYQINSVNFTASSNSKLQKAKKFKMTSSKTNSVVELNKKTKEFYTKIENNKFPRMNQWVKKNRNAKDEDFLNLVLNKIKNEKYYYTLSPKLVGNDYDAFFFDTKEGYCEHYAGAFVILARLANIPARVVTGYYGGEFNEVGNFYTLRQSDAHSWVEVYIQDKGWIRYDPTNIIPLSRVSQNNNLFVDRQIYQEREKNNNLNISNKFLNQFNVIFQYFSFVDYRWTNFFLSYNKNKQKELYKNIKDLNNINFKDLNLNILLLSFLIFLLTICFFIIIKKINNLNFVILEIKKILKKNKINIPINSDISFIFDQYNNFINDNYSSKYEINYINVKYKNKKIKFFEKIKIYLRIKKTALTN